MIVGLWDPGRGAAELRREVLKALPAGRNGSAPVVWAEPSVALGWAPLGLPTQDEASQPFTSEDQLVIVVFEGKIHNVPELRRWLGAEHRLKTESGGELLAHLYEKDPSGFLDRVNGKFAFALWDGRRRRLVLGRDRLGIEPLSYCRDGQRVAFASSLRTLLSAGWARAELDPDALLQYLLYCYNPTDQSMLRDVHRLPPGHVLTVNAAGVTLERYWYLSFAKTRRQPEAQYCEEILYLIEDAIRLRLEPGQAPGILLSGGVDSSGLACFTAPLYDQPLRTFSFRCEGRSFDESQYAKFVARHCGTQHTEVTYGAESLLQITQAVRMMEEPFSDIGIELGTFLLGQAARGQVSYVFSGEGGDELFAGHPVYTADKVAALADRLPAGLLRPFQRLMQSVPDTDQKKDLQVMAKRFAASIAFPAGLLSHRWRIYYTPAELQQLCRADFVGPCSPERLFDGVLRFVREADGEDLLSRSLYSDYFTLVGFYHRRLALLRGLGLEGRSPLLDHRLVEYAATVPSNLKLRGLSHTKYIYRRALTNLVPKKILFDRPKLGHSVPLKNWLRDNPAVKSFVSDTLTGGRLVAERMVCGATVQRMLREHDQRQQNHSHRLWALLVLELWLKDVFNA